MGNRLSKIYTKTGDDGSTGLGDGSRVAKDHARIEAFGCIDELNSYIGVVASLLPADDVYLNALRAIQHDLFDLGGELSIPGYQLLHAERIVFLETEIDEINNTLPPLKEFILPGGNPLAAHCHVARTICRRAERRVFSLSQHEQNVADTGLKYLNRLSDYLFVLARCLARANGGQEILWNRQR